MKVCASSPKAGPVMLKIELGPKATAFVSLLGVGATSSSPVAAAAICACVKKVGEFVCGAGDGTEESLLIAKAYGWLVFPGAVTLAPHGVDGLSERPTSGICQTESVDWLEGDEVAEGLMTMPEANIWHRQVRALSKTTPAR